MTECNFNEKLSAYYDGELEPQARRAFEVHLAGCSLCGVELRAMERFSSALQTQTAMVTVSVGARVRARAQAVEREMLHSLARRFAVAAACLLVASGITLAASTSTTTSETSTTTTDADTWTSVAVKATEDHVPWDNPEGAYTAWMVESFEEAWTND